MLEDSFLEWSEREREPFDDFLARTVRRPGFEPWNLRLVVDPSGTAVGATVVYDKVGMQVIQNWVNRAINL